MKKIYFALFSIATALTGSAQTNLIPNGDFENWTNNTTPTNFTPVNTETFSANNFIAKETGIKKKWPVCRKTPIAGRYPNRKP
ncbi:hypothetical protein [Flavobacterium sp. UBA4197]|uniref:hypothetical protein n=1 Tax=Flavobacterium sp. UBA4197 TaxID=1946546 RepID=UPI00257E44A6|nr:hypothetical protein [Flavobacterium sp. UBA4197]